MVRDLMNTKDVAEYLGINEKQVYALIKQERIPASRATGKWVFPRRLIDEWIEGDAQSGLKEARRKSRKMEGALLAAGSNDPVLDMLYGNLRRQYPEFYVFSANIGSTAGLRALNSGYTDVAWMHLMDPDMGRYDVASLESMLQNIKPAIVHLFRREVGFLVRKGNPKGICGFEDLSSGGVRIVNRQEGSGIRILLDRELDKHGISSRELPGYDREVSTHLEVGMAVLSGEADTGIASVAAAKLLNLDFVPIARESFDMVLDRSTFFAANVQALIELIRSADFRSKAESMGGYDFTDTGKILHAKP